MHIIHIITGLSNGGAEAVLYRLCINDSQAKHTVISLMDMGKYGPLLVDQGVEVHYLNMPAGRVTWTGLKKLYSLLKTLKPSVVQTWMYHADLIGGVIARLAGIKNIFWNIRHTFLEKGKSKLTTRIVARLCAGFSYWVPQKIICCALKALEVHAAIGYQRSKMIVIGNGYELDKFAPNNTDANKIRKELSINLPINLIGMVSRYHPLKDHTNLFKALSLAKKQVSFKCLLVGQGLSKLNTELYNLIVENQLKDDIFLLEQRSDIASIMNALDVHVLSSSSEAFPNVIAEAMACGTPCVTTDVGDAALIVGDTGWVVPISNPQAVADAILQAIFEKQKNTEQWQKRKERARQRIVENFSIEKMIANYHNAWSEQ
ncbi:MAG: glycosyltransferase [Leptonema sp. (in: Bacteria)]|nr:glycosyltransferase [Leptonema sp. (in: bacteria)]